MQDKLNHRVGKATAWSSITEIGARLVSPLVNMILARLLLPEAFALVATINMVISFAEIFADAGFQKYLIQHEFDSREELDECTNVAFWSNLSVSVLLCALIYVFRHPLAALVGNNQLGDSISITSGVIILVAFSSIQQARFKRDFDFKTLFYIRIGSSLLPFIVTVPLAIILKNYWALLLGSYATHLFNAVVLTIRSEWKPRFCFSFHKLKQMLSFSLWTLLESICIWMTSYIGVFIIGNYLSDYYLGLYKTAINTVNSYMAIITASVTPVLFSALSRYQNDEDKFQETFFSFQRLTALLVFPMGVCIYLFRELVTQILLGTQWMEASGLIGLWGLTSAVMIPCSNFASEIYRAKGKVKISLLSQLLHLAFLIPVLLFTVQQGFQTMYTARALIRFQPLLTSMLFLHFLFGIRIGKVMKHLFPILISTLVMGGIGWVLKGLCSSITWQLCCILVCVIIYFSVLLLAFPSVRREIMKVPMVKNGIAKVGRLLGRKS